MKEKLDANIKYFKHLCEKENLLYEEVEKYTIPFNAIRYKVNHKDNENVPANIVIDEIMDKPLIYRLIQAYLKVFNKVKKLNKNKTPL